MGLIEDDTILHPDVDEDYVLYISGLNEGHEVYTRFFDALLIKRNSHRAIYKDLQAFREQPRIIHILQRAADDRSLYKGITRIFLESRFAHPWCRKTPLKKGFWRAEWGNIDGKKKDTEISKEEQRLHKLLVPIWVIMQSKMFPDEETVRNWCVQERIDRKQRQENRLTMAALEKHNAQVDANPDLRDSDRSRQGNSDSDLDEEDKKAATHAATSILRLAAAGMIISQTPKRKLRWLVKK